MRLICCLVLLINTALAQQKPWKRTVIFEGEGCTTAVAEDFTGDGMIDVIADTGGGQGTTRLFVGPDWQQVTLDNDHGKRFIHSESFDIDSDGDFDYIGAQYNPGKIIWYECPDHPLTENWQRRLIDDQVHGIHGLLKADVDRDGRTDLLATSAQPIDPFPNSLAWFSNPLDAKSVERWQRNIFADRDAPGLSHYLGFGDINQDGRPDAASAAKGGPQDSTGQGEWFAWWESPKDPRQPWTRHRLPGKHSGATNIHPCDVNGNGKTDLVASRGHGIGVLWFEGPDWKIHEIDRELKEPHCLGVADIDADGDTDIATCAFGSKLCVWYENDGNGKFTRHIVGTQQEAYDIRIVDMDNDDDLDFLIAGRQSKNIVWYANPLK